MNSPLFFIDSLITFTNIHNNSLLYNTAHLQLYLITTICQQIKVVKFSSSSFPSLSVT